MLGLVLASLFVAAYFINVWNYCVFGAKPLHCSVIFLCFVILMLFMRSIYSKMSLEFDYKCPSCGKSIQKRQFAKLAIVSGKCGHCGKSVFRPN